MIRLRALACRRESLIPAAALTTAAILRLYRLGETGQNLYYAATVRSMLVSWHNFFFVSFDPAGALAIDKPPLGLWLQVAAARLFGFHYWALALPQVLAGVAAVGVIYRICRRRYGLRVAGAAAFMLAVLPVSVASGRNNSLDTLTMFLMLLSAWGALRAAETGRWRWLAVAAVLAGLAFNTKMFAAFVPLPALLLSYLSRRLPLSRVELVKLSAAFLLLFAVSFSWVTAVGLTPADERPYIYNGFGNSAWGLTLRYNGLNRLVGSQVQPRVRATGGYTDVPAVDLNAASIAPARGPQRLLFGRMGTQLGWFLPLAFAGLASRRRAIRAGRPGDVLWATWLLTGFAVLALAADTKDTHLELLAAPVATEAALGLRWLLAAAERGRTSSLLLVAAISAHTAWLLAGVTPESRPMAVVYAALALALLSLIWRRGTVATGAVARRAFSLVMVAWALAGPLYWSAATALQPMTGSAARYPIGGPAAIRDYPPAPGGDLPVVGFGGDPVLTMLASQPDPHVFLVLTERSLFGDATRYILLTGRPVLTLDSFADQADAATALARLVDGHQLRYIQLPARGPWSDPELELGRWFQSQCRDITGPDLRPFDGSHIYDCAAVGEPAKRSGPLPAGGATGPNHAREERPLPC